MTYKVIRSFYEGNTLHLEGEPFTHQDQAYVEKNLADGNIAATDEAPAAPSGFPQHTDPNQVQTPPAAPGAPAPAAPLAPTGGSMPSSAQAPVAPNLSPASPPATPPAETSATPPSQEQLNKDMEFASGAQTPPATPSLQ